MGGGGCLTMRVGVVNRRFKKTNAQSYIGVRVALVWTFLPVMNCHNDCKQ